jgi:hypothetical protein
LDQLDDIRKVGASDDPKHFDKVVQQPKKNNN